jgi:hypothetical protein
MFENEAIPLHFHERDNRDVGPIAAGSDHASQADNSCGSSNKGNFLASRMTVPQHARQLPALRPIAHCAF